MDVLKITYKWHLNNKGYNLFCSYLNVFYCYIGDNQWCICKSSLFCHLMTDRMKPPLRGYLEKQYLIILYYGLSSDRGHSVVLPKEFRCWNNVVCYMFSTLVLEIFAICPLQRGVAQTSATLKWNDEDF